MNTARRVHELETIARISTVITAILDEAELLTKLATISDESFPEFQICIYLLRGDMLQLIPSQQKSDFGIDPRLYEISLDDSRSLMSEAVRLRQSRIIDDIARRTSYDLLPFMPQAHSEMAIPMLVKDDVIGVVSIQARQRGRFSEDDTRIFKTLVDLIAVAVQNARLYSQAKQLAIVEERNRLSRELHDSVSQALYGIVLGAQTAQAHLRQAQYQALPDTLNYVLSLAKAGLDEIRSSIFDLRPRLLEDHGLIYALQRQVLTLETRHGMQVELRLCDEPSVDFVTKHTLYRILREAMHNIVKHSQATQVTLKLWCEPDQIAFDITDNGVGFTMEAQTQTGLGLQSMHERIEELAGTLTIDTAKGKGTRICGSLPIS